MFGIEKWVLRSQSSEEEVDSRSSNNADGSMKLPLLFVSSAAKPRCFGGRTTVDHGVDYCNSLKGWMTTKIFGEWVSRFDARMRGEERHVLLLLDNASSHCVQVSLTSVMVHMLPPNTTSHLQPQDAGVIQSFKKAIERVKRREAVKRLDRLLEDSTLHSSDMEREADTLFVADLLTAVKWAEEALREVTAETISNCWRHTGILDDDLYELVSAVENLKL